MIRERNFEWADLKGQVDEALEANKGLYTTVRLRCVATQREGALHSGGWVIQAWGTKDRPAPQESAKYAEAFLLESWVDPAELPNIVDAARRGQITVDKEKVAFVAASEQPSTVLLGSGNMYGPAAGHCIRIKGKANLPSDYRHLLAYDLPFYSDVESAAAAWLSFPRGTMFSSVYRGSGVVFLPELRAHFSSLLRRGSILRIVVDSPHDVAGLRVLGEASGVGVAETLRGEVVGGVVRIRLPADSAHLQLVLVGPDGTIYDHFREGPQYLEGLRSVLQAVSSQDGRGILARALASGEGDHFEFKTAVDPTDSKKLEDVESAVIAFLNTEGGMVFLGIEDDLQVSGIEVKVMQWARNALGRAVQQSAAERWYLNILRQKVAAQIVPSGRLDLRVVTVATHRVLLIAVSKGRGVHYDKDKGLGSAKIRRGASTVSLDLIRDRPDLYEPKVLPFGWQQ